MRRNIHKLSARAVATLTKPGRHSDGGGLYLFISKDNKVLRRRWLFRFTWQGKVREMGLGSATQTSLAEARAKAAEARREFAAGKNPIEAREAARKAAEGRKTFGDCATALIAAKSHEWRNSKHRAQWRTTLETYAAPVWNMPVDEVYTSAVLSNRSGRRNPKLRQGFVDGLRRCLLLPRRMRSGMARTRRAGEGTWTSS